MVVYQKVLRAFDVVQPVEIYRVIGRRLSQVWVDAERRVGAEGPGSERLKELTYWRTSAVPGDSIQERVGGIFIVAPTGESHPITLLPPQPLEPATAFLHAKLVRERDIAQIESFMKSGELAEVFGRKSNKPPSNPGDRLLAADHALIVDDRPVDLDDAPAFPKGRGSSFRRF